jgi:HEAT repeat protein
VKTYSGDHTVREVIKDIFSDEASLQISGLQFIISQPSDPFFEKALLRMESSLKEPRVIASYVKALAHVQGRESLSIIAKYLRHKDARVRANCIEALEILEVDPSQKEILEILMNFLGDDPRVAGNCIRILASALRPAALMALIEDYFDREDPRKCLNILYLIRHLKLDTGFHIVETCLNHESKKVQERATELLKFLGRAEDLEQMSLRTQEPSTARKPPNTAKDPSQPVSLQEEQETLEKLRGHVRTANHQEALQLLQEVSRLSFSGPLPDFLRSLLVSKSLGLDPFVLATAVKCLAQISTQDEWEALEPYLNHENSRVSANTVEALVILHDLRVLPHLRQVAKNPDLEDSSIVRLLSSGIQILKTEDPYLALEIMQRFSHGNLNSISSFVLELDRWEKPEKPLIQQVIELLKTEIRLEIVKASVNFLEIHAGSDCLEELLTLIKKTREGQKKKQLSNLYYFLMEKYGLKPATTQDLSSTDLSRDPNTVASDLRDKLIKTLEKDPIKSSDVKLSQNIGKPWQNLKSKKMATFLGVGGFILIMGVILVWSARFSPLGQATRSSSRSIRSSSSRTPDSKQHILKAKGVIQSIDPSQGRVRVASKESEYEVEFQDNKALNRLDTGQKVKFIGRFLEKDPADVFHLEGRFIFQDKPMTTSRRASE